jgi:hypothetical protein
MVKLYVIYDRPRRLVCCLGCRWVMSVHRFANHRCTRPKGQV